jgi:hypothetical protein
VVHEPIECGGREPVERLAAQFAGHAPPEMLGEQRNMLGALAEGRDRDDVKGELVDQVMAEAAALSRCRQVDIGGGDDADIDVVRLVAADALKAAIFDDAQDLLMNAS